MNCWEDAHLATGVLALIALFAVYICALIDASYLPLHDPRHCTKFVYQPQSFVIFHWFSFSLVKLSTCWLVAARAHSMHGLNRLRFRLRRSSTPSSRRACRCAC